LGEKFGLRTMRALMSALSHPERSFESVLVAGTNGKGSVSAYLDAALRAASLRVGRYTSPHLIDVRERITVSGRNIGNADFERLVLGVRDTAERLRRKGAIETHPNHFEILTAVAFLYFRERQVEIAVLEVGLGGRLDATNVASPLVSAIVSIDFDHEEYLGRTLSAIAREKAGVLRRNRVAVLGPMAREAEEAIVATARIKGARLVRALERASMKQVDESLLVRTPLDVYSGVRSLPGAHQRTNLMVAVRTLESLRSAGLSFDLQQGVAAMSQTLWPGRLEPVPGRPPFLLDGAHNPAGAKALARHLRATDTPHILIFGAMRDKHIEEMAKELFPGSRLVVATRVRMARAAAPGRIAELGRALGKPVIETPSVGVALARAARNARHDETVVVAGSLYLVGAVRKRLLLEKPGRI
jgi:dihydrofolate synthase/folylpolyglutamate synthase